MTGLVACRPKDNKVTTEECIELAPYLYSIVIDDYNFNRGRRIVNHDNTGGDKIQFFGACTEVRHDNIIGRNLDWNINYEAAALMWVKGTPSISNDSVAKKLQKNMRHASVGMVGACPRFQYGEITFNDTLHDVLPLCTTDGVNDHGVYIGVNVVPTGETTTNPDNWNPHHWGYGAAFTQKDSIGENDPMCVTYLTRIVLNYADSVDEAISIINKFNWFDPYSYEGLDGQKAWKKGQSFHWMICDRKKSAVIEFIDNKLSVIYDSVGPNQMYGRIMTNFSNSLYNHDSKLLQGGGSGYERFDSIVKYIDTHDGNKFNMKEIIQAMHFSKFYHEYYKEVVDSNSLENYRFKSEFADPDSLPAWALYPQLDSDYTTQFEKTLTNLCGGWPEDWTFDDVRKNALNKYWYSTHTCIYDLDRCSVIFLLHEGKEKSNNGGRIPTNIYWKATVSFVGLIVPENKE